MMKMKAKGFLRAAALLVMAAMTLGLCAGCGGGEQEQGEANEPGERAEYVYVADYKEIEGDFDYINSSSAALSEDTLYFASYKYSSVDPEGNVLTEEDEDYWTYYTSTPAIFSMATDGSQVTELTSYVAMQVPEGSMGNSSINAMSLDAEGNLWVFESVYAYHYEAPEGVTQEDDEYWNYYVDDGSVYSLRKLDKTGAEISSIDLGQVFGDMDNVYISGVVTDKDGNIYISDGNTSVYVLNSEGSKLFTVEMSNWIDRVISLADGRVAALGYDESGQVVKAIDVAAKAWGDTYDMPTNVYNLYSGGGDYLFYCGNDTAFYGYNADTGESEKILNWLDSDIDSNGINFIMPLDDGRILSMSSEWDSNYTKQTFNLITLVKTPSSELPQKTILTYACTYLDWNMRSLILDFNKTNDKYRIEVRDYSEYNTDEDYSAGLTKLTTEIVSGNVPDLLQTSELPIDRYAAKGLLEDLYTYMDADAEMGRDKFVPAVLNALQSEDGKLYQMISSFYVYSVMGDGEKIGYEPGWTLDELQSVMAQLPDGTDVFSLGTTREQILHFAISFGMDDYVNWETGECNFNSEDFVSLLEFCNSFPAEFDWENHEWTEEDEDPTRIMSGKQLLLQSSLSSFEEFQLYSAMFNDNIVFKGFPCQSRNGNALSVSTGIAMTTSCADKQGGWEFIKTMLSAEYQIDNVYSFPSNQEAFDNMLEESMTPEYYTDPETGEEVEQSKGGWGWGSLMVEIYAISQEEADEIVNLINSIDKVYGYDNDIMNIVTEECAAFFNGEKSAQDTAGLIQSRVNIYVNEQR